MALVESGAGGSLHRILSQDRGVRRTKLPRRQQVNLLLLFPMKIRQLHIRRTPCVRCPSRTSLLRTNPGQDQAASLHPGRRALTCSIHITPSHQHPNSPLQANSPLHLPANMDCLSHRPGVRSHRLEGRQGGLLARTCRVWPRRQWI